MKKQAIIKQAIIHDLKIDYETEHRKIKHPRIEFKTGRMLLILPENYSREKVLLKKHRDWIHKKLLSIKEAKKDSKRKILENRNNEELKFIVNSMVEKFSGELNVKPQNIHFMILKSKWGSCSAKKRLTFNLLLKYLPEHLVRYVVFHEVLHLGQKEHDDMFWRLISRKFKDYEKNEKELLAYWFLVQEVIDDD